ncbi:MAG TPA: DUF983 domain-containing protein [Puia sp.]|nr:DUF983 domain-containing protein [Puia sp.]
MKKKKGLLQAVLTSKCPRCREGRLFEQANPYALKELVKMPEACPVCGQDFEIEPGFYYGTGFVSYALAVMFCVASFITWLVAVGISLHDHRFFWWIGINALLLLAAQPLLMRLSRTIWLTFFVSFDPDWLIQPPQPPERMHFQ